jgi:hypothetical protein
MRRVILLLFSSLVIGPLSADCQEKQRKWRIRPLPVVYYSPETRLGFGILGTANANLGDSSTMTSYLQSSVIYTLNQQYEISNIGRLYTNQNKHIVQYRFYYTYFPEYYYGYETSSPEDFEELIDYRRLWIELRKYWKIRRHYYGGLFTRFNSVYDVNYRFEGGLSDSGVPGNNGYHILGLAPSFSSDKRDSQVYPRSGHFVEVYWMAYPGISSNFVFGNFRTDWRIYRPLNKLRDDVLTFQLVVNLNEGTVPFRDMADIGGPVITRGYYRGYYRFKNLYALQAEYRFMVHKYVGFAAWVGGAFVSEVWTQPFEHSFKPNAGIGLRLRINQKDKLNLRADYGFGTNQSGLYFDASEAF